ncbi:helix-turn-helix transcriptional regulator [Flavobacteriaceae bacterium GF1]
MKNRITRYESINAYLEAANCSVRSELEDFFIVQISNLGENTVPIMSAFQKNFFQINIITTGDVGAYRIDERKYTQDSGNIYFISPAHIYSWVRNENLDGYLIYFKKSLFDLERANFLNSEFDGLFNIENENMLSVGSKDFSKLREQLEQLQSIYTSNSPCRRNKIIAYLTFLLFFIKEIWLKNESQSNRKASSTSLFKRYLNLVASLHLKERKVLFYAEQLGVTPNHLNAISKRNTGKTAKEIIEDNVVKTAKLQLSYSDSSISDISYSLGFEEPTNFSRFFKRITGKSPQEYKYQNN